MTELTLWNAYSRPAISFAKWSNLQLSLDFFQSKIALIWIIYSFFKPNKYTPLNLNRFSDTHKSPDYICAKFNYIVITLENVTKNWFFLSISLMELIAILRTCSQSPVYGLTGRALGGRPVGDAGRRILQAKSWNKVYSLCRYPFMNNNGCQIYFILLLNLLDNTLYSLCRYPFMNNNGCQIYFILLLNLLDNTRHALSFWCIVFIRLLHGGPG